MRTEDRRQGRSGGMGTIMLATLVGVGVGLLAAPQPGTDTRRALRKRLATAREGLGDQLEELEERSRPARRAVRARAEELSRRGRKKYEEMLEELEEDEDELEDDDESSGLSTILAVGAGIAAAAYLLSTERAAPVRERVREAAATVRDEAEARWDRFQHRRENGQASASSGPRIDSADSAPNVS